ncbi:hypothetical protein Tco_0527800 [Tanacetum coccineum]
MSLGSWLGIKGAGFHRDGVDGYVGGARGEASIEGVVGGVGVGCIVVVCTGSSDLGDMAQVLGAYVSVQVAWGMLGWVAFVGEGMRGELSGAGLDRWDWAGGGVVVCGTCRVWDFLSGIWLAVLSGVRMVEGFVGGWGVIGGVLRGGLLMRDMGAIGGGWLIGMWWFRMSLCMVYTANGGSGSSVGEGNGGEAGFGGGRWWSLGVEEVGFIEDWDKAIIGLHYFDLGHGRNSSDCCWDVEVRDEESRDDDFCVQAPVINLALFWPSADGADFLVRGCRGAEGDNGESSEHAYWVREAVGESLGQWMGGRGVALDWESCLIDCVGNEGGGLNVRPILVEEYWSVLCLLALISLLLSVFLLIGLYAGDRRQSSAPVIGVYSGNFWGWRGGLECDALTSGFGLLCPIDDVYGGFMETIVEWWEGDDWFVLEDEIWEVGSGTLGCSGLGSAGLVGSWFYLVIGCCCGRLGGFVVV